jgi:hypothetical protein
MESFRKWRWVLVGISAVLAIVLIANGNVLIGALVGAMAIVRIVMFSNLQRRRAAWRGQYRGRVGGGTPDAQSPGPSRGSS